MRFFAFFIWILAVNPIFMLANAGAAGDGLPFSVQIKPDTGMDDLGLAPKEAPPTISKPALQLADNLAGLFKQLKRTRDDSAARRISVKVWQLWQTSNSKSIDLLTHWARVATGRKQFGAALDLLDQVVVLDPEYAEGWNQRATLHFIKKDYVKSVADIERTLALEPRHFGALGGLANIQGLMGQDKNALATWYRVLEVYPAMESAQNAVIRLEEKFAGRPL